MASFSVDDLLNYKSAHGSHEKFIIRHDTDLINVIKAVSEISETLPIIGEEKFLGLVSLNKTLSFFLNDPDKESFSKRKAEEVASWPELIVRKETLLLELLMELTEKKIHYACVEENAGKFVDIITDRDIINFLLTQLNIIFVAPVQLKEEVQKTREEKEEDTTKTVVSGSGVEEETPLVVESRKDVDKDYNEVIPERDKETNHVSDEKIVIAGGSDNQGEDFLNISRRSEEVTGTANDDILIKADSQKSISDDETTVKSNQSTEDNEVAKAIQAMNEIFSAASIDDEYNTNEVFKSSDQDNIKEEMIHIPGSESLETEGTEEKVEENLKVKRLNVEEKNGFEIKNRLNQQASINAKNENEVVEDETNSTKQKLEEINPVDDHLLDKLDATIGKEEHDEGDNVKRPKKEIKKEVKKEVVLNLKNRLGLTLLMTLVLKGDRATIEAQYSNEVRIDEKDPKGRTAFMYAFLKNDVEMMEYLAKKNANLDILDKDGKSPLILSTEKKNLKMLRILFELGANKSVRSKEGHTILMIAAERGWKAGVAFFIQAGVDLKVTDAKGRGAGFLARQKGFPEIDEMIKEAKRHTRK